MNEKNLKPQNERTKEEQREIARMGGVASGKARREKKAIQTILNDLLNSDIKDIPQFSKLAVKMGIDSEKSVKEIFTLVCLLNSVKSGNLSDLERLAKLIGEQIEITDAGMQDQTKSHSEFIQALKDRRRDED